MPVSGFSHIGDRLTAALIAGDFDRYREVIELPLTIVPTGESPYSLLDETALHRDFLLYHSVLKLHGVTDIFREVRSVIDEGGGIYRIVCRVHMMVRANRITEPFQSEMLIRQRDGQWRILEIRSLAAHIDWALGGKGPGQDFLKR